MMEYTIVENFNIQGENRVQEFKEFLSANMRNSSLRVPIQQSQNENTYSVSLSSNIKDVLMLEILFDSWKEKDKGITADKPKPTFISGLQKLFRTYK